MKQENVIKVGRPFTHNGMTWIIISLANGRTIFRSSEQFVYDLYESGIINTSKETIKENKNNVAFHLEVINSAKDAIKEVINCKGEITYHSAGSKYLLTEFSKLVQDESINPETKKPYVTGDFAKRENDSVEVDKFLDFGLSDSYKLRDVIGSEMAKAMLRISGMNGKTEAFVTHNIIGAVEANVSEALPA